MVGRAYIVATLLFLGLVAAKFDLHTGFTSLIRFGETWQDRRHSALNGLQITTVAGANGYDGQFYAQVALDPLLRGSELAHVLDAPSYRARRILAPATAALLGLGRPWWVLQIYALLNVVCWFVLARMLKANLGNDGWLGFARWFGCLFSLGILDSVRQSLVDLPALLLLILAIQTSLRSRSSVSVVWLTLANLAKETSCLGALALVEPKFWKRSLALVLLSSVPVVLWICYVQQRLGPSPTGMGLQQNFDWPLIALLAQATTSARSLAGGDFDSRYLFGLLAIGGFVVQVAVVWKKPEFASPWWRLGALYSGLLLVLGPWVWSGYWAVCRAVLPLTIAFNLILPPNRWFWPLWLAGNITVIHGIWRFI